MQTFDVLVLGRGLAALHASAQGARVHDAGPRWHAHRGDQGQVAIAGTIIGISIVRRARISN